MLFSEYHDRIKHAKFASNTKFIVPLCQPLNWQINDITVISTINYSYKAGIFYLEIANELIHDHMSAVRQRDAHLSS
jgi:hypothetical protein